MNPTIRSLATPSVVCWNCGKATQDYKTYWYDPRIKEYLDGPRLVFPHITVCSECQVKPFSNKQTLEEVTVSDILGHPITKRMHDREWNMITEKGAV